MRCCSTGMLSFRIQTLCHSKDIKLIWEDEVGDKFSASVYYIKQFRQTLC